MIWLINSVARLLMLLILLRVVASWLDPRGDSEYFRLLRLLTEPVLAPIRRLLYLPGVRLDFSPLAALLLIELLRGALEWILVRGLIWRLLR